MLLGNQMLINDICACCCVIVKCGQTSICMCVCLYGVHYINGICVHIYMGFFRGDISGHIYDNDSFYLLEVRFKQTNIGTQLCTVIP